jgi:DivIVA domain-containing protein
MMWFFAILVVLVMGGVAALAAGRGAPMSDAYDDRPDALVPKGVPLRAAFRGYRMSEVDALLDRVARQLDEPGSTTDPARQGEVADTTADREVRGDDLAD